MISEVQKAKTLFLWLDSRQFHAVNASARGIKVADVYSHVPPLLKIFRRIQVKYNLFSVRLWLNSWVDNLNEYDTVILHASKLTPPVVDYINKVKPEMRVIVWYWNPIAKSERLASFLSRGCEVWTFDDEDSRKYGIRLNTQYYFSGVQLEEREQCIDALFVGGDKGRLELLQSIKQGIEQLNLRTDFHIVGSSVFSRKKGIYKKRISYEEILKKISHSKSIVDVVAEDQSGLTLRPLEALFYGRKLITNDVRIVERDFYSRNNVFVIGHDSIQNLPSFLNMPFEPKDEYLIKYDFDQWLARFFSE